MGKLLVGCFFLFGLFVCSRSINPYQQDLVDKTIERLLKCANIKSLSLAFVNSNGASYSKGYDDETAATTTRSNSSFCIGGITQTFTSVLLAKIIDENENITWETPISDILGRSLGIPDKYISDHLNLKDILAMRSGLAGMDFVPVVKAFKDRQELLSGLRFVPPVAGYRERYVHNEVLFAYIEDVVKAVTGLNWIDAIRRHILQPLGMTTTYFIGASGLPNYQTLVKGTYSYNNQPRDLPPVIYSGLHLIAPAASICTSADDMAKWLRFLTTGVKNERNGIIKKQALETTYKALVPRDNPDDVAAVGFRDLDFLGRNKYTRDQNALGWIRGSYKGNTIVSQDGTLPGYHSLLSIALHKNAAVYVAFTGDNDTVSMATKILLNMFGLDLVVDESYDMRYQNICQILERVLAESKDWTSKPNRGISRVSPNDEAFNQYAGDYRNYAFGEISVKYNETGKNPFTLTYGEAVYRLDKTNVNETFQLINSGDNPYWYHTNSDNNRKKLIYATFKIDQENRYKSVIITGFDKDIDVEFSTHPTRPIDKSYYYDSVCDGSSSKISSLWLIMSTALICYFR